MILQRLEGKIAPSFRGVSEKLAVCSLPVHSLAEEKLICRSAGFIHSQVEFSEAKRGNKADSGGQLAGSV